MFSLSKNCAQAVGVMWDKPVAGCTQVIRSFEEHMTNSGFLHRQPHLAGKLRFVLSPAFPQPISTISQMERASYAQYPHHLLLRLLFNIIRERHQ